MVRRQTGSGMIGRRRRRRRRQRRQTGGGGGGGGRAFPSSLIPGYTLGKYLTGKIIKTIKKL